MKKNYNVIISALLMAGAANLHAIGDLQISLQGTNVVLSWASTNSDYYLVQYSTNLHSSHPWQTLTNWMPGSDGTNTVFVHSGAFQIPTASPSSLGYNDLLSAQTLNQEEIPLAMRADDPNSAAPFFLYPPGFDFSGFLLYDPETQTWHSGNGFTRDNPPNPLNPGTNTNSTVTMPVMYFYRVARNGVYLSGLTNGTTLSGTVSIPLEVVGVEGETVTSVCLREDGSVLKIANTVSNSIPDHIDLDTTRLSNGVHDITAWIECLPSNLSETNFVQMSSESSSISLNISNVISFPGWIDRFGELGNRLQIEAYTIYPNAPVQIDIQGSQGTNLASFTSGTESDGSIYALWLNLADTLHTTNYYNEPYFSMHISVLGNDGNRNQNDNSFTRDSDGHIVPRVLTREEIQQMNRSVLASASQRKYRQCNTWTTNGNWVIAQQQAWDDWGVASLNAAVDKLVTKVKDENLIVRPSGSSPDSAFRIDYGANSDPLVRSNQWYVLADALFNINQSVNYESRNFFYLGHAAADRIGSGNVDCIMADDISQCLQTDSYSNPDYHAYRFVFLFGCNTANGKLPEAFGIKEKSKLEEIYYQVNSLRPNVFIGWDNKHTMSIANVIIPYNINFIDSFADYFAGGANVENALEYAKLDSSMPNLVFKHLKIYGCKKITITNHNTPIIAP